MHLKSPVRHATIRAMLRYSVFIRSWNFISLNYSVCKLFLNDLISTCCVKNAKRMNHRLYSENVMLIFKRKSFLYSHMVNLDNKNIIWFLGINEAIYLELCRCVFPYSVADTLSGTAVLFEAGSRNSQLTLLKMVPYAPRLFIYIIYYPADIWRNNKAIISSKRRCDVVLT